MLRSLLLVFLGLIGCETAEPPPMGPARGVDVLNYDAVLSLDPATLALSGHVTLSVRHPDDLPGLSFGLAGLQVDSVLVDGAAARWTVTDEALVVAPGRGRDTTRVRVHYGGTPAEGLYAAARGGLRVVYTDSWPDRGRGWLPGVHHPSDPAAFRLTLDVPAGYEAVATGTPMGVDTLGEAIRYRWMLDTPAPTYTFAFAVSDFTVTTTTVGDTLPVHYYMLAPDAEEASELARTPGMLTYFSGLLGPYAYDQYAAVEIPFDFGGMENASAVFLQARLFDRDAAEAVQVHEAAHQWFGNRVVIADWEDLWLSEGFATYLTTLYYEHADGLDEARRLRTEMALLSPDRAASHGPLVPPAPVDPNEHLTWIPYEKGASVLHLLRLRLGDEAFFQALRTTYADFAGRPLSTGAFRRVLEEVSGQELASFFDYWIYGDALPVLETRWDPAERSLTWEVRGDEGTLAGVPFELAVEHAGRVRYVPVAAGRTSLPEAVAGAVEVAPVGVLMRVE